jgi:hypothetical protein
VESPQASGEDDGWVALGDEDFSDADFSDAEFSDETGDDQE